MDDSEPEGLPPRPRGPKDYLDLTTSQSATEEQLRWLAGTGYPFVLEAVARHPTTPVDVLERLAPSDAKSWNDQSLLLALAEHPASSPSVLSSIARQVPELLHERDAHPGFEAGIALFRRRDIPEELLLELLDNPDVQQSSARSPPGRLSMGASWIGCVMTALSASVVRLSGARPIHSRR